MTDEYIDEAIASGGEDARLNADNAELENDTAEQEQQDDTTVEGQQDDADSEGGKDKFPKKAVNALNRKDRKINALNAQLRQMEQQMQQFQQLKQQQEKNAPVEPNMEDFEDFDAYIKAKTEFHNNHFSQQNMMQQREMQMQQHQQMLQQQWTVERANELDAVADELAKNAPELPELLNQNQQVIESFPPHVQQMFLQADSTDACHAFYALAKEGKLQQLSYMSPHMAATEIGRAADRGAAMLKKQTISKAPAPMSQNRGNGRVSKSLGQMNHEEIGKWLES